MKTPRRSILKKMLASVAGLAGFGLPKQANARVDHQYFPVEPPQEIPLYSSSVKQGNLVFLSGIGAHFEGDIASHTDHVLKEMEKELKKVGSSMEKVLKVNVLLHDPNDYKAMNEIYKGRFGSKPPVRTTVGVRGGVPGDSLVEIDCIAYI